MKKNQIDIITLGCSKNLVDSERLMGLMERYGYHCTHDSVRPQGEIAVINTCGFIADAKEESINTILEFVQRKEEGKLRKLFVMGCLSERYKADLEAEIPGVDGYYGKFDYPRLLEDLKKEENGGFIASETASGCISRHLTTPKHYAYLKIAEGCDRHCAYCAIPIITGRHQSRPMEEILAEVEYLVSQGVKEFQVIAQELTYYGVDIDGKQHIAELVERMADIPGVKWIRLHYAYPTHFPWDLLKVMREKDNVCKYLDIALQHISTNVLSNMRRNTTKEETIELIKRLREEVPGICLRTTMMVGYPGETDEDFNELIDFVKWARFERLGAFAYSEEEGTYSAEHFKDDIPEEVKQARLSKLMRVQQRISHEIMDENIGKTLEVVIDRRENDYYIARSQYSSPEVDPEILISAEDAQLKVGEFYNVEITDSEDFDLYAKIK